MKINDLASERCPIQKIAYREGGSSTDSASILNPNSENSKF